MTSAVLAGGNGDQNCTQHYDSFVASASFGKAIATTVSGDASKLDNLLPDNLVSGSTQLATDISGSFDEGFEFTGTIGITTDRIASASFGELIATNFHGDASQLTNSADGTNIVSSSAQLATDISGSFDSGFEFTGTIGTAAAVWSSGPDISYNYQLGSAAGVRNATVIFGKSPASGITSHYNGSAWSLGGSMAIQRRYFGGTGTEYAALAVGNLPAASDTEEYYGETWAAGGNLITARAQAKSAGTQNAALAMGGAPGTVSHFCCNCL